ncbi:MAG TPA: methyltransferase domain-containing protein [Terriglobales bacterium]|nr:methyltransferase domain-containing protein [Terriglobales bacterium]
MAHAASLSVPESQSKLLLKVANKRLFPRLTDPSFLMLRSRRRTFEKWIDQLDKNLAILDVGGRYQPYRPLFSGKARRYLACDILQTELVDVIGHGELLPFAANTFDVVVATQVFEYFPNPHNAARQMHAALKPSGCLMMSVAATAPRFVDDECWRFTPKGIRETLSSFSSVVIVPELSSIGGVLRTLNLAVSAFSRNKLLRALVSVTVCPLLNLIGAGLEALHITNNDQFTPNYSVLAIK